MSVFGKLNSAIRSLKKLSQKEKKRVFLIGGFLRDSLLGRSSRDLDFTLEKDAIKLAGKFARTIRGVFVLLDEDFGCARVVKKIDDQIYTFDFADFKGVTLAEDLKRRDFTINTFTCPLEDFEAGRSVFELLKDQKKPLRDLKSKTIRMVSAKSLRLDPLRCLRAFSLRAQLGFTIETKTLARIKKDSSQLKRVSAERIRDELFKILKEPRAAVHVEEMKRLGLLEQVIPQVHVMFGVHQGGYHHLDVWKHSLETLRQLEKLEDEIHKDKRLKDYLCETLASGRSRFTLMKLAALLHDIGKPEAKIRKGKRTLFYGHERISKGIVHEICHQLKLAVKERHALEDMVLWHLRPGYLSNFKVPSERMKFRFLRDAKDEAVSILFLSLADQRATRGPLTTKKHVRHHEAIVRELVEQRFRKCNEKPFLRLINGYDLINKLKLKPSPLFATILKEVEEAQVTGQIKTKREALALARKVKAKKKK